jgi:putative ribosome biogenesis GTPase RsgA
VPATHRRAIKKAPIVLEIPRAHKNYCYKFLLLSHISHTSKHILMSSLSSFHQCSSSSSSSLHRRRFKSAPKTGRRKLLCVSSSQEQEKTNNTIVIKDDRIPITILTGFLGSGKTTLLNHILTQNHGEKMVVIENDFGEIDIDGDKVHREKSGNEDILLLNNGCLCCSV